MLLAELGHEVVRVEVPDWHLQHRPFTARPSESERAFFDRRKKSITFPPDGLGELAGWADAVIDDLGFGGLANLRATPNGLRRTNPNIVVASISPFGLTGPKSRWEASELVVQASAGVLHSTGWIDGTPQKAGGFSAHHIAGINAATAVLSRCYGLAAGTCKGGHIDVSMQETYIPHYSRHVGEWTYSGTRMRRERQGFGHQGFRHTAMAADGYLYVLSLYATWDEIALFFGLEQFLAPEWSSAEYRLEHWPEIAGPYLETVASKPRYEWFRIAAEAGYTFAPVHAPADQFENPQFAARGFLKPAEILGRTLPTPGLPFPWPEPAAPNRPPAPGEHTAEFFPAGAQR
jgi:crotonobetainyl-CoA:carnitine CoA-transferase CaiB-like acyl-CoA transferase